MEKTVVYKRTGKFGKPEFLIGLDNFHVIKSKETPKAYAIGEYQDWKKSFYIDCWIAKSMCVEIEGKIFVPTWMLDKLCDMTQRINQDYYGKEFEVKDLPELKTPEKSEPEKPIEEDYCVYENFDGSSVNGENSSFGKDWRKGSFIEKRNEIEGAELFLLSCYDKYEDGYCVFACNEKSEICDPNRGHFWKYKIISEVQFRGNCEYPSKYGNKFAGEKTFEKISKLEDFENLKNNIYYFLEN